MSRLGGSLATLLCLVIVVVINPLATLAQQGRPAVLDTAGRPLRTGNRYYILPKRTGNGGGLTLVRANSSCPLYVGQDGRAGSTGLPVTFLPFVSDEPIIRESSDFSVSFVASSTCPGFSTDWSIDPDFSGRELIPTGKENQPSPFLRISRDGNDYKLGYCPIDVCPLCRFRCGDAGIVVENGKCLLALHVPALPVVFRRA